MALYYDYKNKTFYAGNCEKSASSELVWKQEPPRTNMYSNEHYYSEDKDINRIKVTSKRTRLAKDNTTDIEYLYYLSVSISYRNCVLWPFSLYDHYLINDSETENGVAYISSTLSYNVKMKDISLGTLFEKAYDDASLVCNTHQLWLYSDMLRFLDKLDEYAKTNLESPYFQNIVAKVVDMCSYYGKNLNTFFLITGKKRLLNYALVAKERQINFMSKSDAYANADQSRKLEKLEEFIELCKQF